MASTATRPVAVVTGSTSGIGQATAFRLADEGYDIVVHGLDETGLDETLASLAERGARTSHVVGDLVDPDMAGRLVAAAGKAFGRLDGLVNNAGAGFFAPAIETSDEQWRSVFALHTDAVFRLCREAHPLLSRRGGGIANISSVAAFHALAQRSAYGTAKAAVAGITKTLATEWAADGIRVNAVAPGTIETPLVRYNFEQGLTDKEEILRHIPMGRLGRPDEVAEVLTWLVSQRSSYVTGQVLFVDGGWTSSGGW